MQREQTSGAIDSMSRHVDSNLEAGRSVNACRSVAVGRQSPVVVVLAAWVLLVLATLIEGVWFASLVSGRSAAQHSVLWLIAHGVASALTALSLTVLLGHLSKDRPRRVFALFLAFALTMPLVGAMGAGAALLLGFRNAIGRHREQPYWQFTDRPELPFTLPRRRQVSALDGRGIAEQLEHDADTDSMYRKVLAASRMPSVRSVDALTRAVRHSDERIRLTAYQTLDRKVSTLNAEIQRLEADAEDRQKAGRERSDTWLQIASNYWELLTLEQGEPIAREQLLGKAAAAALKAIEIRPKNRNAHFTFGRIALRQGKTAAAQTAFEQARLLGMPAETTLPYQAEAAFHARKFDQIGPLLGGIDKAFLAYPPLADVAEHWR